MKEGPQKITTFHSTHCCGEGIHFEPITIVLKPKGDVLVTDKKEAELIEKDTKEAKKKEYLEKEIQRKNFIKIKMNKSISRKKEEHNTKVFEFIVSRIRKS